MTRKTFCDIHDMYSKCPAIGKPAKLLGTIVLASFMLISLTSCIKSTGYKNVIEHPGKLELIYYGYQLNNPSQYKVVANGKEFFITKTTVVPSIQSIFLLENISVNKGDAVLDIGTGAGIQAIFAAEKASKVVATDLNQDAVDDTIYNAKFHGLEHKIDVRQGDLFGPVKEGEKFDVIIFNIDYPYNKANQSLWDVHERFFANVRKYMNPGATIFYQAGWLWNIPKIVDMIEGNDFVINRMNMVYAFKMNRQPIVFTIQEHPNLEIKKHRLREKNRD
ncbi:methyltransferase [Kaarinaea lacus]